jgi:hypothetical protein
VSCLYIIGTRISKISGEGAISQSRIKTKSPSYKYLIELDSVSIVLSNNVFLQQYEKLQRSNIIEYIDVIVTSDEVGEEKPNVSIFHHIREKMCIPFAHMAFVGDDLNHDILPSIKLGMLPIWFRKSHQDSQMKSSNEEDGGENTDRIIEITDFSHLYTFFERYFQNVDDYLFLSKYFGSSILNVQGPGGNISIKMENQKNNLLFIKSSGFILGNTTETEGYCILNNDRCLFQLDANNTNKYQLHETKVFGYKTPSMETYFHCFMKKYTVHLHFVPATFLFCSDFDDFRFSLDFKYKYYMIKTVTELSWGSKWLHSILQLTEQ